MIDNYAKIAKANLENLYAALPADLAKNLPARQKGDQFIFEAFGETCTISPEAIKIGDGSQPTVLEILISLYALHARPEQPVLQPFKSYKDFPDSMPYMAAFTSHTEQLLVPHVSAIAASVSEIKDVLKGEDAPAEASGDFSFLVYPLPKIALCYIFYEADEDFPASCTCLFSNNARVFLPVDALADVGEYTSRKIMEISGA